ncbi:MAG: cupin domain-containing protein [Verrucomicrobiota bacterium]
MHRIRIADVPWDELRSPRGTFRSYCRNLSVALGGIRNGGPWCGGHPFDLQIRRVPPGAAICPFHSHVAQWELFVVLSGTATIRAGSETHTATTGEVFVHPPGEPHQLLNKSAADLEVLIIADNPVMDAFYYPDSDKWGLRPPGKYFRLAEVGYFDGEEEPLEGAPPYQPSGTPPPPALTPFAQRKLHPDSLTWEAWSSPNKKFHGSSKELSPALGAKWNTPVGLGGHPFDLELNKVAPGACPCPFHSHAAEWELFYILSGTATVRLESGTTTVAAGEIVLHPPGEAHQIANASTTHDLLYYIVADNSPVEYWRYPDSDKWGLRSPRKHFRATDARYYDGEE